MDTIHAWLENQTQSSAIATDQHVRAQMMGQCRRVVGVLQILAGLFALGVSMIQVMLALRVSSYARTLCRKEDAADEEKQVLEAYSDDAEETQEKPYPEES